MSLRIALVLRGVRPARGGAETYVADLCRSLVARNQQVTLLAQDWDNHALPPEVKRHQVHVTGLTRKAQIWSFATNAEAALRSIPHDCSVGFINTWGQDVLIPQGGVHPASVEANSLRYPAGWQRSLYRLAKRCNPSSSLYRAIERRQYDPAGSTRFVAVSQMVRGHLERYHQVDPKRIGVIPNAIDPARLNVPDHHATRAAYRQGRGLHPSDVVGLFVAHNFRLKGLEPLLHALARLVARQPSQRTVKLLVCGGGALGPFRRVCHRLGLAEHVRLIGFEPDVASAFHAADFFVLPSYYDPCSLVVLEALGCGLPVITTRCNGAGELITPGAEGFVIPRPDDLDALSHALAAMRDDRARARMAQRARAAAAHLTFDRHVNRLLALFQEVVATRQLGRQTPAPHLPSPTIPTRASRFPSDRASA